jgi:hypothetical protein
MNKLLKLAAFYVSRSHDINLFPLFNKDFKIIFLYGTLRGSTLADERVNDNGNKEVEEDLHHNNNVGNEITK